MTTSKICHLSNKALWVLVSELYYEGCVMQVVEIG